VPAGDRFLHLVHGTVNTATALYQDWDILDIFTSAQFDRPLAVALSERSKSGNEVYFFVRESSFPSVDVNNKPFDCCVTGHSICKSFVQGHPSILIQFDPQMDFETRKTPQNRARFRAVRAITFF
jgi:hypothetical protein